MKVNVTNLKYGQITNVNVCQVMLFIKYLVDLVLLILPQIMIKLHVIVTILKKFIVVQRTLVYHVLIIQFQTKINQYVNVLQVIVGKIQSVLLIYLIVE